MRTQSYHTYRQLGLKYLIYLRRNRQFERNNTGNLNALTKGIIFKSNRNQSSFICVSPYHNTIICGRFTCRAGVYHALLSVLFPPRANTEATKLPSRRQKKCFRSAHCVTSKKPPQFSSIINNNNIKF